MKKIIIALLVIIILGVGYWLVSPIFINHRVSESLPLAPTQVTPPDGQNSAVQSSGTQVIATGSFHDVLAGHHAKGVANLLKINSAYYIRFEDDFEITNGPDLVVYLGKDNHYDPAAKIAGLKGNIGSQNYEIPSVIDVSQYDEVWIWCRSFSVPFGAASLQRKS